MGRFNWGLLLLRLFFIPIGIDHLRCKSLLPNHLRLCPLRLFLLAEVVHIEILLILWNLRSKAILLKLLSICNYLGCCVLLNVFERRLGRNLDRTLLINLNLLASRRHYQFDQFLLSYLSKLVNVPEVLFSLHNDLVALWINVSKFQSSLNVSRFSGDLLRVFASHQPEKLRALLP